MKIIGKPSGGGKTLELIKMSHLTSNYIVCSSKKEAGMVEDMAKELGYKIPLPITYDEFINKKYYGKNIKGFLIDDADMLLQYISEVKIVAITLDIKD
jgi:hypothetical protein